MRNNILSKRFLLVCFFVCFSIVSYGIINIENNQNNVASVNALPISNKRIVIDARTRSSRFSAQKGSTVQQNKQ